jgi:hypothetical protein
MVDDPDMEFWVNVLARAVASLPPVQGQALADALEVAVRSMAPALRGLPLETQTRVVDSFANIVLGLNKVSRDVVGEDAPLEARIDTILNQVRVRR